MKLFIYILIHYNTVENSITKICIILHISCKHELTLSTGIQFDCVIDLLFHFILS